MFVFEKLQVRQRAKSWANVLFDIGDALPQRYQFSFGEQLRRAGLSVMNNLAEGASRESFRSQRYFYEISKGSTYECVNILFLLQERKLVTAEQFKSLYQEGETIAKMTHGLIAAAQQQEQSTCPSKLKETSESYSVSDLAQSDDFPNDR